MSDKKRLHVNENITHMESKTKPTITVWIGLSITIALDTVVQISWKSAVASVPATAGTLDTVILVLRQPLCHFVFLLFLLQLGNWMILLSRADLSYVQPITSLSLVSVTILSSFYLKEHVSFQRFAGMMLILLGVWFISRTRHRTALSTTHKSHLFS